VNDISDHQLLREYLERRSESAFGEVVRRHIDLVYSAALRMVRDAHLAEDVTQNTFLALAQHASQLTAHPVLSGWLHCTTRNLAAKCVRAEVRRRAHEQEAAAMNELLANEPEALWKNIAPHLDDALAELGDADRDALLLRYFERKSAREMGQIFGTSEEAAQKRVSRAVERLRESFSKRSVEISASALVVIISANAVKASPSGLAAVVSTALARHLIATVTTKQIAISWITMKLTTGIIIGAVTAAAVTYLVMHNKAKHLERQNQDLAAQQHTPPPNQDASPAPGKTEDAAVPQTDSSEILRLRGQVGVLRQQSNELGRLQSQSRAAQSKQLSEEIKKNVGQLTLAARLLTDNFESKQPLTNIIQLKAVPAGVPGDVDLNKFELVSNPAPIKFNYPEVILLREKTPRQTPDGQWARVYGMVDGQAIEQISADGNFEPWEKQHLMPAQPTP
jgi:RNA polymerase sigma factor (sigma-70 family)